MWYYQAYGLRIESAFELPELMPAPAGRADIALRPGLVQRDEPGLSATPNRGQRVGIRFDEVGTFLIDSGCVVRCDIKPALDPRILRLVLLGPILGIVLHQRGYLVLHASAVQIGSRAVAFVGHKGAGKSTTAAAFAHAGHSLLTDDVAAISPDNWLIYPGFPQLKLWREAATHHGQETGAEHRIHPDLDKVAMRVADRFAAAPARLHRIFALRDAEHLSIESLAPQEAFVELITHSYTIKLAEESPARSNHFAKTSALADAVSVRKLLRPRSLSDLPRLVRAVVADAA